MQEIDGRIWREVMGKEDCEAGDRVFSPSTDIADAMRVVEHMSRYRLYLEWDQMRWQACIGGHVGEADNAPLAICRAALRAMEAK